MGSIRTIDSGFIKRATEVVMLHMDQESFSGNELGDHLALSREQTHRKLKQSTALSTGKFIRYIRLLKACVYLIEGRYSTADVFYLPPGHTAIVEEGAKLIDFSPTKEFGEVMDHIAKKMEELSE